MNKNEVNLILQIIDLSLKYGVPTVQNAIERTNKDVITKEDIEKLKIDSEWEEFFDE
ncbi:MAG: hypothetical protein ACOCZ5_03020 [bacterium]